MKLSFYYFADKFTALFDAEQTAVYAQVIVAGIVPCAAGVSLVMVCTSVIYPVELVVCFCLVFLIIIDDAV